MDAELLRGRTLEWSSDYYTVSPTGDELSVTSLHYRPAVVMPTGPAGR